MTGYPYISDPSSESNFEKLCNRIKNIGWRARLKLEHCDISELEGKTITSIEGAEEGSDVVWFVCSDGSEYIMYHEQDCCESVDIEDISGDINDLLNSPIRLAKEITHSSDNTKYDDVDSYTWTYYILATVKSYVNIRWYGESNGYYSESVDFIKIK